MKVVRHICTILIVIAVGAQFVRPERSNPPASDPLPIRDPEVESILRTSCFDCHSNETRWPWYSEVAPMSWLVADHVDHGREHMNFSDWDEAKAMKRFEEICGEIKEGEMPIWNYLLLHPDAKLSSDEISTLCSWSSNRLQQTEKTPHAEDDTAEH